MLPKVRSSSRILSTKNKHSPTVSNMAKIHSNFEDASHALAVNVDKKLGSATQMISDSTRKNSNPTSDNVNASLHIVSNSLGTDKTKSDDIDALNQCDINMSRNIKTLEDVLICFGLESRLQQLEESLLQVRCGKKTKLEHKRLTKKVDMHMQKLFFLYNINNWATKGISQQEMAESKQMQKYFSVTRTALNYLNKAFLEDIYASHKYAFYTELSLNSIQNGKIIWYCLYKVLPAIDIVSEIKQQRVIFEIRRFLRDSQFCLNRYLEGQIDEFKRYRESALSHLKKCIEAYEILHLKLGEIKKEYSNHTPNIFSTVIHKVVTDCKKDLTVLTELKDTAKESLNTFELFVPSEVVDPYFVLPFII